MAGRRRRCPRGTRDTIRFRPLRRNQFIIAAISNFIRNEQHYKRAIYFNSLMGTNVLKKYTINCFFEGQNMRRKSLQTMLRITFHKNICVVKFTTKLNIFSCFYRIIEVFTYILYI